MEKHILPPITKRNQDVLHKAIYTYGKERQTDMAIEKMSELTKALLKNRSAKSEKDNLGYEQTKHEIYEKIADVVITLTQLVMIYGGGKAIEENVSDKIGRLNKTLSNSSIHCNAVSCNLKGENSNISNADRIRSMTNTELAEFFNSITEKCSDFVEQDCSGCPLNNGDTCNETTIEEWLESNGDVRSETKIKDWFDEDEDFDEFDEEW